MLVHPRTQVSGPIRIFVNWNLTVEQMVQAGGYDWRSGNITSENFPIGRQEQGWEDVYLVHFNRSISGEDAILEIDRLGLQPAELPYLLSLGASRRELQRAFAIVALGSFWEEIDRDGDKHKNVPVIWGYVWSSPKDRRVSLIGLELAYFWHYRFLARKKRS